MQSPWIVLITIVSVAVLYILLPVILETFNRYRAKRAVLCPDTRQTAEVTVDAVRAAAGSAFGKLVLQVKTCSLWPERRGCAQSCLETSEVKREEGLKSSVE